MSGYPRAVHVVGNGQLGACAGMHGCAKMRAGGCMQGEYDEWGEAGEMHSNCMREAKTICGYLRFRLAQLVGVHV